MLQKLEAFMSVTRHEPDNFPNGIICASMFSMTSPTGKVRKCKINVKLQRKKWLLTQKVSDPVIGVSVVQDQKRPGHMKIDHSTNLLIVNGTNSVQVFVLIKRKKGGAGTHFKNRAT